MLLQEADKAAMQLERQTGRLAESQQKIRDQDGRIAQLLAEIKELKAQVKYLTKQLEMAVEDLETEAKQTERFTNTFFDWSQRFNDGSNGNRSGSVEKTNEGQRRWTFLYAIAAVVIATALLEWRGRDLCVIQLEGDLH